MMSSILLMVVFLVLLASIFVNFFIGATIFMRGAMVRSYRLFAFSSFSVVFWALGDMMMLFGESHVVTSVGRLLFLIAPMVTTYMLVLFSRFFLEDRKVASYLKWISLFGAASLAYMILVAIQAHASITIEVTARGYNSLTFNRALYGIYAAYLIVEFSIAYVLLFVKQARHVGRERAQLMYAFDGIFLSSILALNTNVILPLIGHAGYVWLGPIFTIFYVVAITLAIVRHQLFDIRLLVMRSVGYLFTVLVLAGFYGLIVFGLAAFFFHLQFSLATQLWMSVAIALAALSFSTFQQFFNRLTDKLFFRDAYNAQDLFDDLNRALVSTMDLDELLKIVTQILQNNLRSEFCLVCLKETNVEPQRIVGVTRRQFDESDIRALRRLTVHFSRSVIATDYLEDEHAELRRVLNANDIAVLVRLTSNPHQEGLGYVAFGQKKSGNSYNNQDYRVMDTVANSLNLAIQNALHFEETQNFNETLQAKIADATRQLRNTNQRLKALDETKDDFISMASHQLRTPLTSVKGYISMVIEGDAGPINPTQAKMLNQAFVSSQRMVYLIADLLNVSRLRTGKFVLLPVETNLADIVTEEASQLKETAQARGLTLAYKKPTNFPSVLIDDTKIRQVMMNFMDNAVYYTPPGGTVKIELIDSPKAIEFRVTDNGIGVPRSEQHHLFTKFYRAANARQARPDGTGLGLYMARKVVVAQGGVIIFESQEGKGSTFGFSLQKAKLVDVAKQTATPVK